MKGREAWVDLELSFLSRTLRISSLFSLHQKNSPYLFFLSFLSGTLRISSLSLFSLYHFKTTRPDRLRKKERKKKTWEERPTNFSSKYLFFIFFLRFFKISFLLLLLLLLRSMFVFISLWVSIFLIVC